MRKYRQSGLTVYFSFREIINTILYIMKKLNFAFIILDIIIIFWIISAITKGNIEFLLETITVVYSAAIVIVASFYHHSGEKFTFGKLLKAPFVIYKELHKL